MLTSLNELLGSVFADEAALNAWLGAEEVGIMMLDSFDRRLGRWWPR